MKKLITTTVAMLAVLAAARGQDEEPAEGPPSVPSKITAVTVYAGRAQVTRTAGVQMGQGTVSCTFQKLPGWIDEESVRVSVSPPEAARIADVRVARRYLARSDDKKLREAQEAVDKLSDELGALDDETKVLDAQAKHIEAIKVFSLEKVPHEAAAREISVKSYEDVVKFLARSQLETARARRKLAVKRRELEPELTARRRALKEVESLTQLEETTITVVFDSPRESRATLQLTYMLPGATWEPVHELRAAGKRPEKAELTSYAVVSQTTGEDWGDVDISFSTQSPAETIRIPELEALFLNSPQAVARLKGGAKTFVKAEAQYKAQNVLWYNYQNPGQSDADFRSNIDRQEGVNRRTAQVFETLRQRGTTAHFRGGGKPTIRSDGRLVRVPIGRDELRATSRVVAAPQASLNAAHTIEMVNTSRQPLLPGQVSLFHDGAFVGLTDLDFVASGEPFSAFLGVADRVKLERKFDRQFSSISRGKRTRMQVAFVLTVENLGDDVVPVSLTDRVPVSENSDIQIDRVRILPEADPDKQGMVKWDFELQRRETRVFRVEYRVDYPPAVVRQQRTMQEAMPSSSLMDADLSIQLEALESRF